MTNNLQRRITEHRDGRIPGFTAHYKIFRLVHFECFGDIRAAIAREKEIKGWRREKKLCLIQRNNRTWQDLAQQSVGRHKNVEKPPEKNPTADPSPPFVKNARPGSG